MPTFFQSGCIILCFHHQWMSPCCSTFLLPSGVVSILDFGHSNRSLVISYFCLHFPDDIYDVMMIWSIFSYAYLPSVYLLWWRPYIFYVNFICCYFVKFSYCFKWGFFFSYLFPFILLVFHNMLAPDVLYLNSSKRLQFHVGKC